LRLLDLRHKMARLVFT